MEQRQAGLFGAPQADDARMEEPVANPPADSAAFEDLVAELDTLVGQLEAGQLSLEDSLGAFERGMLLSRRAAAILDAAEHRIEQLTGTPEAPVRRPMDEPIG